LPRRSSVFRFRVYQPKKGRARRFTEFTVPNPHPGVYPPLKPEPVPAVRSSGPLQVSLVRLEWGVSPSNPKTRAAPGEKGWTGVRFRVLEGGKPVDDWLLNGVTLSDA